MTSAFSRSACLALAATFVLAWSPAGRAAVTPATAVMPIDWTLAPAQIAQTCKAQIAAFRTGTDAIVQARSARTFASVVVPFERLNADLNDNLVAQGFLYNTSTDAKVRDASLQCSTDIGSVAAEIGARPELYAALLAAQRSGTAKTPADVKLTQLWVTQVKRSGAGLPVAKRTQFVKLSQRLNDLQNRFAANLGNDQTTIAITADQVKSLPADFVAGTLKKNADGSYTVPVNEATTVPFMRNETDATARKTFYVAYAKRGGAANVDLLQEAILTREQMARLLGYSTWASFVLEDKMAQSPARVQTFLAQIDRAILPKAKSELVEDAALKGGPLDSWDIPYYENQFRKTKYALDQNEVKQYYPVDKVIPGVLGVYEKLLSLKFTRSDAPVWEPSVLAYDVTDLRTNQPRGRFYLDLYPRPGKYNHFACWPLIPRRTMPDGSTRLAVAAIVGNWPKAAPGKPALLQQGDVETFFHEFGHNMANMLAQNPYETLNNGFRADFVEAPSQMLENWVWQPEIIKQISANVETGAPMPDDLIKKLIATRYVHNAYATTTQILYATVDMRYHTATGPVDTTALWRKTVSDVTPLAFVEGTVPQAGFGHLMGGYDAGYYGYLWSKVYAQDMFTRFQRQGLENPAAGFAYRDDIVGPARLREPDREVQTFLGRPMSPDAFYRELGITPPSS